MIRFLTVIILLGFLGLTGCTETVTTSSGIFGEDEEIERRPLLKPRANAPTEERSGVRPGALARGNDQFVNPSRAVTTRTSKIGRAHV